MCWVEEEQMRSLVSVSEHFITLEDRDTGQSWFSSAGVDDVGLGVMVNLLKHVGTADCAK